LIDLADEGVVQRIFLALGTDASTGAKLRSDGWITVAALHENDDAVLLGCTHKWTNGQAIPV
jgi:ATP phosphoribosyltransferase regulatory subunit